MFLPLLTGLALAAPAIAQYSGSVGPLTPLSAKTTICNVLDYGAVADNATDLGPAILAAYDGCVGSGTTLLIPNGTYSLQSTVTLDSAVSVWAFQLDGLIIASYAGTISGNMIVFKDQSDLEVFSSNALGAINGQGYVWRSAVGLSASKPRLMRFTTCTDFSVHDLLLVDAPQFHLVVDSGTNAEIANLTIRGPSVGGSDGIDISGSNYYVHDCDVSNRDECVSVKSPSTNATIARMRCNQSGGMSIGSLQAGAAVENVVFDTIDNYQSTQGLMIKTYPSAAGIDAGYVRNVVATHFRNWAATYTAYIQQYWENSSDDADGAGVQISNVSFTDWSGSNADGYQRGVVMVTGSKYAVPYDITFADFDMYTEDVVGGIGELNKCFNVYGSGGCVNTDVPADGTYTSGYAYTQTVTAAPSGWTAPADPTWGVSAYPVYEPIPVYTPVPTYPLDFGDAAATAAATSESVADVIALATPVSSEAVSTASLPGSSSAPITAPATTSAYGVTAGAAASSSAEADSAIASFASATSGVSATTFHACERKRRRSH